MNMAHLWYLWMIYLLNMAIFHGCVKLSNGMSKYVKKKTLELCLFVQASSLDHPIPDYATSQIASTGWSDICKSRMNNTVVMPQNFICIPAQRETEHCWGFGKFSATCITPQDHFFFAARRPGPRFWEPYSSSRLGSQNLGCRARWKVPDIRKPRPWKLALGSLGSRLRCVLLRGSHWYGLNRFVGFTQCFWSPLILRKTRTVGGQLNNSQQKNC